MKTISKLFTTCTLILSGALVTFGVDPTTQQGPNPMPQKPKQTAPQNAKPSTPAKPANNKNGKDSKAQPTTAQNGTKTTPMKEVPELKHEDYAIIIAAVDGESAMREIKKRADQKLNDKEKIKAFLKTAYKKANKDTQDKIKKLKESIETKLSKQSDNKITPETNKEVWDMILILHQNQKSTTPPAPASKKAPANGKKEATKKPQPSNVKPASRPVNTPAY